MAKKKKVNPRNVPATQADVNRAKKEALEFALKSCWAIFFTAMRDKYGWGHIRLKHLWDRCNEISQSITQGYIDINDLITALRDEAGIELK